VNTAQMPHATRDTGQPLRGLFVYALLSIANASADTPVSPPLRRPAATVQIYRACKAWQKLPSAAEEADARIKLAKRQAAQDARAVARQAQQDAAAAGTAAGAAGAAVVGAYATGRAAAAAVASMKVQLQQQQQRRQQPSVKAEQQGRKAAGAAAGGGGSGGKKVTLVLMDSDDDDFVEVVESVSAHDVRVQGSLKPVMYFTDNSV
jgi:hypothetical protein